MRHSLSLAFDEVELIHKLLMKHPEIARGPMKRAYVALLRKAIAMCDREHARILAAKEEERITDLLFDQASADARAREAIGE